MAHRVLQNAPPSVVFAVVLGSNRPHSVFVSLVGADRVARPTESKATPRGLMSTRRAASPVLVRRVGDFIPTMAHAAAGESGATQTTGASEDDRCEISRREDGAIQR